MRTRSPKRSARAMAELTNTPVPRMRSPTWDGRSVPPVPKHSPGAFREEPAPQQRSTCARTVRSSPGPDPQAAAPRAAAPCARATCAARPPRCGAPVAAQPSRRKRPVRSAAFGRMPAACKREPQMRRRCTKRSLGPPPRKDATVLASARGAGRRSAPTETPRWGLDLAPGCRPGPAPPAGPPPCARRRRRCPRAPRGLRDGAAVPTVPPAAKGKLRLAFSAERSGPT